MIQIASNQAKRNYDQGVQKQPSFQVGQKVLLHHDNITTTAPSKTLAPRFLGPFLVVSKISDLVYQLKLPKALRIHNVFHVSQLETYQPDIITGRKLKPPPPIVTPEGDIEWEVHKILDSKRSGRWKKLHYLVEWAGYGPEQNSWEPLDNLKNALDALKEFHSLHHDAPGPHEN